MESQLVVLKTQNGELLPPIAGTTALIVLTRTGRNVKKPAIDIVVGDILSTKGRVIERGVYTLTNHVNL